MSAELIERLTSHMGKADVGDLLRDCRLAAAHIESLEARIATLSAALEPFEELADEGNEDQPDDTKVIVQAGRSTVYTLRLSDLRRARDAFREATR